MSAQGDSSSTWPRALLAVLTVVTTICGALVYARAMPAGTPAWLSAVLLVLFVVLFVWTSFSFWVSTVGLIRRWPATKSPSATARRRARAAGAPGRTAILMPIYNESPHHVFAGLRAIHESLQATGQGAAFDFFVLSDTTNPDTWLAEELAWSRFQQATTSGSRVFYRHRPKNVGRKAGNIADFCERWGEAYRYMLVLDADSVMSGETIVELARRMDDDPDIGILQAPPVPVNRVSLFARCQQFAAHVYGPVFLEGLAWWSRTDGNYWGHNAIIRLDRFINCCGLSKLPGTAPLGGEILSHDFVEAALMRRSGAKVCLAHDLDGSYEECPPTLIDFAQRDQRWCQGNMQHIRLVFSAGMHPVSRLHLGIGAMSYLSSPLWLLFLVVSLLSAAVPWAFGRQTNAIDADVVSTGWALGLFAATMALLLLPKLWGFLLLAREPRRLALASGPARAGASVVIETLVSMLVAPIMMAFHSHFVLATLCGRRVEWSAQQRGEQGERLGNAIATHWKQTVAGCLAGVLVWSLAPDLFGWLTPVLAGLVLAIPLSMLLSSVSVGQALARRGLLSTPEETAVPPVLRRYRHFLALPPPSEMVDAQRMFRRILADPAFLDLHCCILRATDGVVAAPPQQVRQSERQLMAGGPSRVSPENRKAVLSDPEALTALHLFAWTSSRSRHQAAPS